VRKAWPDAAAAADDGFPDAPVWQNPPGPATIPVHSRSRPRTRSSVNRARPHPPCLRLAGAAFRGAAVATLAGCTSLADIDGRANDKLRESAERIGGEASYPSYEARRYEAGEMFPKETPNLYAPDTDNPAREDLTYRPRPSSDNDANEIIQRFNRMTQVPADAEFISLPAAIRFAQAHAPEYLTGEEAYIVSSLRLLIEEHRWGPRFFNETAALFRAREIDDGRYNTTVNVLNDFGVTQRLPYGGEIAAQFLVDATQQLDNAIGADGTQSADILLAGNIPLLRGAGLVAQEPLIQARRNLIYAARDFQEFRRRFYFDVTGDYLELVLRMQEIANAERQVAVSQEVEEREAALVVAGRTEPFQEDLARQNTLFAIDRLAQLRENFRFALDRFKVRIGMETTREIAIDPTSLALPIPQVTLDDAVRTALDYRLDLQTSADRVDDARRRVNVAKNNLLGDLNVELAASMPTDQNLLRSGLQFRPDQSNYTAGLVFSAPLDRVIEEAQYRETQILLEQLKRDYWRFRDNVAVQARQAVRAIEKSQFSLLISEKNVSTARNRQAAIDAQPDRASARDRTEAVNGLQRAEDQLAQAQRDLQLAILAYLLTTGQLRVTADGNLAPLPGMNVRMLEGPGLMIDQGP